MDHTVLPKAEPGKRRTQVSTGDRVFDIINLIFWILILLIVLYPLWLVLIDSVSDPSAVIAGQVYIWPVGFSLQGYETIFKNAQLMRSYGNSIVYTLCGTSLSVIITMMAAYVLSQRFSGKRVVNFMIVFTMFFSGGLIPSFLINRALGLYDTPLAMVVLGTVSVWNLMIARTYITSSIPRELYEASEMDGASHFTYFFRIVMPLSGSIIAVLCVYFGVTRWNDYFTALVYIRTRSLLPLQTVLREIIATMNQNAATALVSSADEMNTYDLVERVRQAEVAKYCSIVVSTVPAVVLYICMQKYFVKGVMIGSIKG